MTVIGARGDIRDHSQFLKRAAELEKKYSATIQFFRADRIFGTEHLVSAAEKAERSFYAGTNMAKTLGMEIMLYAAAERQTSEALRKLGIFPGITAVAAAVVGEVPVEAVLKELGLERDDSVLAPEGKDPAVFGIIPEDLAADGAPGVCDLVLEKVALSEVYR